MNHFDPKKFQGQIIRSLAERLRNKVEAVYCIEHNQFAQFIIEDEAEPRWRIAGCCQNLLGMAKAAISEE